ncbi:hypothetical protein [Streptomyces sp. NPDC059373]
MARSAKFGRGEETLADASVRDTWELTPGQLTLGGTGWTALLDSAVEHFRDEFGLPRGSRLRAELSRCGSPGSAASQVGRSALWRLRGCQRESQVWTTSAQGRKSRAGPSVELEQAQLRFGQESHAGVLRIEVAYLLYYPHPVSERVGVQVHLLRGRVHVAETLRPDSGGGSQLRDGHFLLLFIGQGVSRSATARTPPRPPAGLVLTKDPAAVAGGRFRVRAAVRGHVRRRFPAGVGLGGEAVDGGQAPGGLVAA